MSAKFNRERAARQAAAKGVTLCTCRNHKGMAKARYSSQEEAQSAAMAYIKYSGTVRAYPCPSTTGWHLTTRTR